MKTEKQIKQEAYQEVLNFVDGTSRMVILERLNEFREKFMKKGENDWNLRRSCGCQPWNETDLKKLKAKILEDVKEAFMLGDPFQGKVETKVKESINKRFGF